MKYHTWVFSNIFKKCSVVKKVHLTSEQLKKRKINKHTRNKLERAREKQRQRFFILGLNAVFIACVIS